MNVNHLMSGFRQRLAAANSKDGVGTTLQRRLLIIEQGLIREQVLTAF